jgi:hypothetical protein
MAFPATTQLYQREANLLNSRAQQEYDRYISDLARQYGIAEGTLNANLEGRGIYRSGEASTARTRLSAENQALKSAATQDLEYRKNMNEINLLKQLASLQAGANQGGAPTNNGFDPNANQPSGPAPYKPFPTYGTAQYDAARKNVTRSGMGSGRPTTTTTPVKAKSLYDESNRLSYKGR